jgi:probable rRNA maturation factor
MAERILSDLGYPSSELAITVVGDRTIRRLNREYLQRDKTTNVISFPMQEGEFSGINPEVLGDVVISADTTDREASEAGIPFESRFAFLVIHGILHLTGFDHERCGEEDAAKMEAKEREVYEMLERERLI